MKRKDALTATRIAGYHDDSRSFTRLLVEHRISKQAADNEWTRGKNIKKAGVPCSCHNCKKEVPK